MFDGREYYAAKSVTDGKKRYMVGWESIRENCRDSGRHLWGGNILVHELVQREDGTLGAVSYTHLDVYKRQEDEEGNSYVRADYSGNVYKVDKEMLEVLTGVEPYDFIMGIANLVYRCV